ncbi:MAG: DUF2892 domain-containing protein [Phycisphaerales bacterium]|jgi:uncharacterized membrane protein
MAVCNCRNVGAVDRIARVVIGIIAITLAFTVFNVTEAAVAGIVAGAVGVVMLITGALGFCPIYVPLKCSTEKSAA